VNSRWSHTERKATGKAFLRTRISRCTRERHIPGAIVGVDFYERTAIVKVSQQLNSQQ